MLYTYVVKPNDSIHSIANKFKLTVNELLLNNTNISRSSGEIFINQKLNIPLHLTQSRVGVGDLTRNCSTDVDCLKGTYCAAWGKCVGGTCHSNSDCHPNYACFGGLCVSKENLPAGSECEVNTDCTSENICEKGYCVPAAIQVINTKTFCEQWGGTWDSSTNQCEHISQQSQSELDKITLCEASRGTWNGSECIYPEKEHKCTSDDDCPDEMYCDEDGTCVLLAEPSVPKDLSPAPQGNCTDDAVIRWAQSSLPGVKSDGKWGCKSQRTLERTGSDYRTLTGCSGDLPDPCIYPSSNCVNNKCPVVASGKKDLTKTGESEQEEPKSSFPWGWIATGVLLVAAGGGIYYYTRKSGKHKEELKSSLGALEAGEPARRGSINNSDREQWIDNDEGLYSWWKLSRLSKREFIKQNKAEIDAAIRNVTEGTKQAHYLKYDPIRKYGHLNEPTGKTWTIYCRNELLGSANFTGTFKSEQEAIFYAKLKASRSRQFATFEVWTGTPRDPIKSTDFIVRGNG